jgi:hypothetical protein
MPFPNLKLLLSLILSHPLAQQVMFSLDRGKESTTSKVLSYFLMVMLILLILTAIGYGLWHYYYTTLHLKLLCQNKKLSDEEIKFFHLGTKKTEVEIPTLIIEKRNYFDSFSNALALTYKEFDRTSIFQDSLTLYTIRKKLAFRHGFYYDKVRSSRALPLNHPIEILYYEEGRKIFHIFDSFLVERNELFSIVKAPELSLNMLVVGGQQPMLEVWFNQGDKWQFRFESQFCFYLPAPDNLWYITHSKVMKYMPLIENLNILGLILYSPSESIEDVEEYQISIRQLSYKQAIIHLTAGKTNTINVGGFLVINFKLRDIEISCQGTILSIESIEEVPHYIILFKDSNSATMQQLIAFTLNPSYYITVNSKESSAQIVAITEATA